MIEMIEMIEMIWAPLAGNVLHKGVGVVRRGGEVAMFGIWVLATPVSGMGFAYGLGRFLKSGIRVLLCRPFFFASWVCNSRVGWNLVDSQVCRIRVSPMVCPSRAFR